MNASVLRKKFPGFWINVEEGVLGAMKATPDANVEAQAYNAAFIATSELYKLSRKKRTRKPNVE